MPSYLATNIPVTLTGSINPSTGNKYIADTIGAVRNAFTSCNFTRLPQQNSGSLSSPSDLNTLLGATSNAQTLAFDMFAFGDSWQATNPLFIKVVYVTYFGIQSLGMYLEMGSQQNGSGSITSVDRIVSTTAGGSGTNNLFSDRVQGSGDGSYISLLVFAGNSISAGNRNGTVFVCERLYDASGQPTGSGFHLLTTGYPSAGPVTSQTSMHGQTTLSAREQYSVVNSRPSRVPAIYNGNLVLGLIYPYYGKPLNPTPNVLLGEGTTFNTPYSTVNYAVYGTTNTYVAASGSAFDNLPQRVYSNGNWLVRYV